MQLRLQSCERDVPNSRGRTPQPSEPSAGDQSQIYNAFASSAAATGRCDVSTLLPTSEGAFAMRTAIPLTVLVIGLACSLFTASAQARARVFVASYGNDSNPCTFGSPC